ncbi:uncharacterized protein K489DRAFT_144676 [Dissoconium aciculare CBS 342.82]|uniref:Uncharacterized protein n=1 Tax=Dissoconium aciculare CBS 342.82 TaxID=1314786 RepID=A0A6J3MA55_9PEZI|nr:uncharacterized protein K489DRAFT_144676 [Dissoconium aciculare CBS 342.82]KAF1824911.1 hypothetical protein K489DRAFT_144676 [Dissoconium aciculare CBS 342.82]
MRQSRPRYTSIFVPLRRRRRRRRLWRNLSYLGEEGGRERDPKTFHTCTNSLPALYRFFCAIPSRISHPPAQLCLLLLLAWMDGPPLLLLSPLSTRFDVPKRCRDGSRGATVTGKQVGRLWRKQFDTSSMTETDPQQRNFGNVKNSQFSELFFSRSRAGRKTRSISSSLPWKKSVSLKLPS